MANPNLFAATQLFGESAGGPVTVTTAVIITCGSGESRRLQSLRFTPKTSTAIVLTVTWTKSIGGVVIPILNTTPVAFGTSQEALTNEVNMMEGDTISYTSTAGTGDWFASWDRILP